MLFDGIKCIFNLRDVVYVMEDDTVCVDDVVYSTCSANGDSGNAVSEEDKFGSDKWSLCHKEGFVSGHMVGCATVDNHSK